MTRVALVTGAASGIGLATARNLARSGCLVVVADRDEAGAERAAQEIGGVHAAVDVAAQASVRSLAETVLQENGAPAVLVNCAGWDHVQTFVDTDRELWERLVAINLLGAIAVTHAFLPAMIERREGRIVNVASDAARVGSSGETVYAAAKGGVVAFTKSVAREVARHGITANVVCPGPTDTPLFRSLPERLQQSLERAIPLGRLAGTADIAQAICFFASPDSGYVTGQVLSVSGGLTMAG